MMFKFMKKITANKPSKYGNKKTIVNGLEFDSKDEAKFYEFLLSLRFDNIELQPKFELQPTFKYQYDRLKIRSINYIADFRVGDIIFDVKGFQTSDFKIKAKLFKYKYPELKLVVGSSKELKNFFMEKIK